MGPAPQVVVLSGGVGGARLAHGLVSVVPPERVTVVVNTGDDFRRYGLHVAPDLDTVLYTLAGLVADDQGWGRAGDTAHVHDALAALGDDPWFFLGDTDLATHLLRTRLLAEGRTLTEVTERLARACAVRATLLPMCDAPVATRIVTAQGEVEFQEWFVRQRCEPPALGVRYEGAAEAAPSPAVLAALAAAEVIVVAPSNPYLSVGPMLALPGFEAALADARAPVVAVSPIIGGAAVKGPAARMLADLDGAAAPSTVARRYATFLDGLLVDTADGEATVHALAGSRVVVHPTDILMRDPSDRARVAQETLDAARRLARRG